MRTRAVRWGALLLLFGACGPDWWGNLGGLTVQQKYQPYESSTFFSDQRSMRPPPPGTVPIERPDGSREVLTGLDSNGRPVADIPIPLDRTLVERGRHDFEIFCGACHGLLGNGDSAVAHKMALRPPPSLIDKKMPPGQVYRVITQGYGLMAPYTSQIPLRERWGIVAYLEALRESQHAPIDRAPAEVRQALEAGRP